MLANIHIFRTMEDFDERKVGLVSSSFGELAPAGPSGQEERAGREGPTQSTTV